MVLNINDLPTELLHSIFTYLSLYGQLQTSMQVCHRWKAIAEDVLKGREELFSCRLRENRLSFNTAGCPYISIPARSDHACCIHGKHLYIFGGFKNEGQAYNDLWKVDLIFREVERVQTTSKERGPSPRGYAFLLPYDANSLILCGGIVETKTPFAPTMYQRAADEVFKFDIKSNTWTLFKTNQGTSNQPENAIYDCCIVGRYLFACYKKKEEGQLCCQIQVINLSHSSNVACIPAETFRVPEMKLFSLDDFHLLVIANHLTKRECSAYLLDVRDFEEGTSLKWRDLEILNNDKCLPNPCQACKVGDHIVVFYPKEGTLLINAQQRVFAAKNYSRSPTAHKHCPHCTQAVHASWKGRCIFKDCDRLGTALQTAVMDVSGAVTSGLIKWVNSHIEFSGSTYFSRGQTHFRPFHAISGMAQVVILGWKPCPQKDCKHPCSIDVLR